MVKFWREILGAAGCSACALRQQAVLKFRPISLFCSSEFHQLPAICRAVHAPGANVRANR